MVYRVRPVSVLKDLLSINFGHTVLNGMPSSNPSPQDMWRTWQNNCKNQREWMNPRKPCLPDTTGQTHMNLQRLWHHAQEEILELRWRSRQESPSLTQKLQLITTHKGKRKKNVSPRESHWLYKPHLQADSMANNRQPTQTS